MILSPSCSIEGKTFCLHELTEAFPVWPFDTATLRRFAVTVAAPLIPLLIEWVAGVGGSLLRPR